MKLTLCHLNCILNRKQLSSFELCLKMVNITIRSHTVQQSTSPWQIEGTCLNRFWERSNIKPFAEGEKSINISVLITRRSCYKEYVHIFSMCVIHYYSTEQLQFTILDQSFLDVLLMEISSKTIAYSSKKKLQKKNKTL